MSTGEDDSSPGLNGRLRPRKSAAATPSPQHKSIRKTEGKLAQDRPKRNSTPPKATPAKQDDLASKSDTASDPLILCPYCDRKFGSKQTATKHARRIHLPTTKQDTFIKCLHCNHSDAEAHAIIKHMVDNHPNQYFACLDCYTRFSSTTELAEHKHNVCEKQKAPYRNRLRQNTSTRAKSNPKGKKDGRADEKSDSLKEYTKFSDNHGFNGIVISCELKPSEAHDATDIEDKITTNLILPPSKAHGNAGIEKNAVIVLDELTWNKRIPPNFSFHNTDADQILSRLGVVHRSPRVGESRKDLIRMMDEPNEKFEKCFDTSFYTKVTKNVQENLAKYLDGSFNFDPNKDSTIKTRKSKTSVVINTAEGFPILLAYEQFSRNLFDGVIPRSMAPKHKWKWDSAESDKNLLMLLDQSKRDSHVNNCIITLVSSLDIWTQLRMRRKFEDIYKTTPTAKKKEKENIISLELKEILESRDIPTASTQVVPYRGKGSAGAVRPELPEYLGLSPTMDRSELAPAVLSGEWVRPRCYVCCACGEQTRDARALSSHITTHHPNAQVQHYEIVGETLLSADILKHLYVPPSQISNRTRPPRGFRDCTKCNKSVTLEDLHQHMLDCAGDTPTVRRKCRYRPFGVRRRRTRLPDNTIRKKIRKDIRSRRHRQKAHMRPRVRTEVGDAESIRKMIADLPAKRNRITTSSVLRPRRTIIKTKKSVRLRTTDEAKTNKTRIVKILNKVQKSDRLVSTKKHVDTDNDIDEDDQPLKVSVKRISTRSNNGKDAALPRRTRLNNKKKIARKQLSKKENTKNTAMQPYNPNPDNMPQNVMDPNRRNRILPAMAWPNPMQPNLAVSTSVYLPDPAVLYYNQLTLDSARVHQSIGQPDNYRCLRDRPRQWLPQETQQQRRTSRSRAQHSLQQQVLHEQQIRNFTNLMALERNQQVRISADPADQRIDLRRAIMSNGRQRGNGERYNVRNDNQCPVGRRDDGNRNSDIVHAMNTPIKHSIASLTSQDDTRNTTSPFVSSTSQSSDVDVTTINESSDNLKPENNVVSEKLDKPPLRAQPRDLIQYQEAAQQPAHSSQVEKHKGSSSVIDKLQLEETAGVPMELGEIRNKSDQPIPPNIPSIISPVERQRSIPYTHTQIHSSESVDEQRGTDKLKGRSRKSIKDISDFLMVKRLECPTPEITNHGDNQSSTQTARIEPIDTALAAPSNTSVSAQDCAKISVMAVDTAITSDCTSEPRKEETDILAIRGAQPQGIDCRMSEIRKSRYSSPGLTAAESINSMQEDQIFCRPTSVQHRGERSAPYDNNSRRNISIEMNTERNASHTRSTSRSYSGTRANLEIEASPWAEIQRQVGDHRRNSCDRLGTLTENEQLIGQQKIIEEYNRIFAANEHNFTKTAMDSQRTDPNLNQYMRNIILQSQSDLFSQRTMASASSKDAPTQEGANYYLYSQQRPASPVSRRTRRKPIKQNVAMEMTTAFYKQNPSQRPDKQAATVGRSPEDRVSYSNMAVCPDPPPPKVNFLPMGSSSMAFNPAKVSPVARSRRESFKRGFDRTETQSNISQNVRDNNDIINKMIKRSTENQSQNNGNLEMMRRHTIELSAARSNIYNYEMSNVHAYQEKYQKQISSPSRAALAPRSKPDEISNPQNIDNVRYDTKSLHAHYSPDSSYVSARQEKTSESKIDKIPVINHNPENELPEELHDVLDVSEINLDLLREAMFPEFGVLSDSTIAALERARQNALRNLEERDTQHSHQRNVSTTADNIYEHFGARGYGIQTGNATTGIDYYSLSASPPPRPPIIQPEEGPLDLTCDSRSRCQKNDKACDVSLSILKTPLDKKNDKPTLLPVTNLPQNYHEISRTPNTTLHNLRHAEHEICQNIILANEITKETSSINERANTNNICDQQNKKKTPIFNDNNKPLLSEATAHFTNTESSKNLNYNYKSKNYSDVGNKSSETNIVNASASDRPLSQRSDLDSESARATMQDEPQIVNKQDVPIYSSQNQNAPESVVNSEVNILAVDLNFCPPDNKLNETANLKHNLSGIKSAETSVQTCSQDILSVEEDKLIDKPETNKNIRLIPKPIVNILHKVPPDAKSLLLTLLVNYVPHPGEVLENYDDTPAAREKEQNNTVRYDQLNLCNDVSMSPSPLAPEKQDSHLVDLLNSNATQPSTSGLHKSHQPVLSHSSPTVHREDRKNDAFNQNCKDLQSSKMDTEMNNDNLTVPDMANRSMTAENNFNTPISSQQLQKLPAMPKTSNEQTASLRAVRIKTTRKSSTDEINLQSHNANIQSVENCASIKQVADHPQNAFKNIMDVDNADVATKLECQGFTNNVQSNCQTNSNVVITSQDSSQNEIVDLHVSNMTKTIKERNENITSANAAISTEVYPQLDVLNEQTANRAVEDMVAEPSAAVRSDDNMEIVHFLGPGLDSGRTKCQEISSQSYIIDVGISENSLVKPFSPVCDNNETVKVTKQSDLENSDEKEKVSALIDTIYIEKETSSDFCQQLIVPFVDNAVAHSKNLNRIAKELLKSPLPNGNKSSDDSDDDVSLAVIKQKHRDKPEIIKADPGDNRAKLKTVGKHRSSNIVIKRKKNIKSKCMKDEVYSININNDKSNAVINIVEKFDQNNKSTTPVSEEIKNNILDETSKVVEINPNQLENEIDALILKDHVYNKLNSLSKNLNPSEKEVEPVIATSAYPQIDETNKTVKECILMKQMNNKCQKHVEYPDEINIKEGSEITLDKCCVIDVTKEINVNLNYTPDASVLNSGSADEEKLSKGTVSTKTSEKFTTSSTFNNDISSELQISSLMEEINKVPLRRSRRGKSMYVDSSHTLRDEHIVQDIEQKPHVTMKRLILSRVEKDKERINEDVPKDIDATEGLNFTDSELTESSHTKKVKRIKRKKSPPLKRKPKKSKSISEHHIDDETSDVSITRNAPDNNTAILRELPNAENKIEDKDLIDGVKNSENTANISKNSTFVVNNSSDVAELLGDSLLDTKEIIVTGKRKLNVSKTTNTVSKKSKKPKLHYKNISNYDFDSDDDKRLLETKQQKDTETVLNASDDISTKNINLKQNKDDPEISCGLNTDRFPHNPNASLTVETRMTCYSRNISTKRPRLSCDSTKDRVNYDPYDIDFEDMLETAKPVLKKRGKNTVNSYSDKCKNAMKLNKKYANKILTKTNDALPMESIEDKILSSNEHHESDSDSSKSDVPLQMYVDQRALENPSKCNDKINNDNHVEKDKERTANNLKSEGQIFDCSSSTISEENKVSNNNSNADVNKSSSIPKKIVKILEKDDNSLCEDEKANMDLNLKTNTNVDRNGQKHNKEKKLRRTQTAYNNDDLPSAPAEIEQQLKSDKFMESFGFYNEKIPRKSNLLASKKISETFHNMISNDSDDSYFGYKEKTHKKSTHNENKKKSEICSEISASQEPRSDGTTIIDPLATTSADVGTHVANETYIESRTQEADVDAETAEMILNSEVVKKMENDLIFGINVSPDSKAAPFFVNYRRINTLETTAINPELNNTITHIDIGDNNIEENAASKKIKSKSDKPPGYKAKMYPDIEEIDMFEDKFDKIKRKRRSQAVAAKQVQTTVETSNRNKSRKQAEKKKSVKKLKQVQQGALVLTKGALKGFDGIKISIPTQDLNMPPSVSPPRLQKRKKKVTNKRRRDTAELHCSYTDSEEKIKSTTEKDIYEFRENEDNELLELRPSTVMDRFRSINKNKLKKEKGKSEAEKDKLREKAKDKERKQEPTNDDKVKVKRQEKYQDNEGRRHKRRASRDLKPNQESGQKESARLNYEIDNDKKYSNIHDNNISKKAELAANQNVEGKGNALDTNYYENEPLERDDDKIFEEADINLPGTSGFVPDRVDESDYDSDVTSPEGDFIFYTSEDLNCVCPSDNDFEDSDEERSCGRLNCVYKNRNADKNTAIGNIFKNNAVRCEKPEIKVPEQPKPDLDQLFDSLFETKPNDDSLSGDRCKIVSEQSQQFLVPHGRDESTRKSKSPISQQDVDVFAKRRDLRTSTKRESKPLFNETKTSKSCSSKKQSDNIFSTKFADPYSRNEFISDSEINSDDHDKPLNIALSPLLENHFVDQSEENYESITDDAARGTTVDTKHTLEETTLELDCNSISEDAVDKPLWCAQDAVSSYSDLESGSQSMAVPNVADLESYVTGQLNTAHDSLDSGAISPLKNEESTDIPIDIKDESQPVEVIASTSQKSKPSKAQSEEKKRRKSNKHEKQAKCDKATSKHKERSGKARSKKRKIRASSETPVAEFAAPTPPIEEQSPKREEEAVSEVEPNPEADEAVAPQPRARRKCTVGKQNILAEHWSSESELEEPPRPSSADSGSKKKKKKKDGPKKAKPKSEPIEPVEAPEVEEEEVERRGPTGPKMRARAAQCWSSDGEDGNGPQPLHGWIVGNSHKKLVTLLAHKKGGKRANSE